MEVGSDFDNIDTISSDDECFHGRYPQEESLEKKSKAKDGKINPIGSTAMELDLESCFRFIQAEIEASNGAPLMPHININPSLPTIPPGAGNMLDYFQENAFVSPATLNAVQVPNQGAELASSNTGGDLQSINYDGMQSLENEKAYQPATLQPAQQLHAMNPLMGESDNMFLGCPDSNIVQNTDGLQYFVVPDDVANALKQMGAASESVIVPDQENAVTDNLMETSSSVTSDTGSNNTEPGATETPNNVENVVPASMQCTSTSTKRRGKKPKLHQNPNLNDPRVKRARGQWEKRENKKKYDEERENKICTLQAELVQLKTELAKRETWKYEMETVAKENVQLKTKLKAAVELNEQLQSEKSTQISNPVELVKMVDFFQDVVSKLPDKCEIIITPRLAEMQAPLLTEESMQRIRKSEEKAPAPSGNPLQLTALFGAPGERL